MTILAKVITGTIDMCTDVDHEHHSSWGCFESQHQECKNGTEILNGMGEYTEYYLAIKMNDRTL